MASVPEKIGPYEIVRHADRYDFSDLYTAYDPQGNRKVSIRVWTNETLGSGVDLFPTAFAPDLKSEILRQGKAAGRLNHDNIAKTYDAGEDTGQGLVYVVYEWFDFRDIWAYTKPAPLLPPRLVLDIIARLASALDHAHRHNVVHLYVNPRTIIFDQETNTLKLIGFEDAPVVARIQSRHVIGTPFPSEAFKFVRGDLMYMAPELVTEESIDKRADLFSLGLLFLSLLIGRAPIVDHLDELLRDIPRDLKIGRWKRRFLGWNRHPDAAAIIRRALERNAEDRYQTGAEMARDILVLADSVR